MRSVCITFDLDMFDYMKNQTIEEMELFWPNFLEWMEKYPGIRTTWFIRIDSEMQSLFGAADYVFIKHSEKIEFLKKNGHQIAWHIHSERVDGRITEAKVLEELDKWSSLAKKYNLEMVRIGGAFQSVNTLKYCSQLGLKADSSAFPRPNYPWTAHMGNWSMTGQSIYYPSEDNYQISGKPEINIVEIPISTAAIEADSDSQPGVIRYINPAYRHEIFVKTMEKYSENMVNLISHPYEFSDHIDTHPLIAFNSKEADLNFEYLSKYYNCITLKELI